MLIRMNSSRLGSPDGISVNQYAAGEVYDLSGSLLAAFLAEGWADAIVDRAEPADSPAEVAIDLPSEPQPQRHRRNRRK